MGGALAEVQLMYLDLPRLKEALPDLCTALAKALTAEGRVDLTKQLGELFVVARRNFTDEPYSALVEVRPENAVVGQQWGVRYFYEGSVEVRVKSGLVQLDIDKEGWIMCIWVRDLDEFARVIAALKVPEAG